MLLNSHMRPESGPGLSCANDCRNMIRGAALLGTARHGMVRHGTARHGASQRDTARFRAGEIMRIARSAPRSAEARHCTKRAPFGRGPPLREAPPVRLRPAIARSALHSSDSLRIVRNALRSDDNSHFAKCPWFRWACAFRETSVARAKPSARSSESAHAGVNGRAPEIALLHIEAIQRASPLP